MKINYQIKKIGEILIENKKSPLKSNGNKEGLYPFFVSGFNVKTINKYLIDDSNIFLPTGGNFFVHYFNGKAAYSTDTWAIKTNKEVNIKYFYYFLILNQEFIGKKLFKGATIKHLQKKDFKDIKMTFPTLSAQHLIVRILDEAFKNIEKVKENTEKNIQNSKDLFEAYLQNIFSNPGKDWEETTIDKTCNLMTGGTPSKTKKEYFKEGTINWLVSGDINKKEIKDCEGKITEIGLKNSNAKYLPINSVMIALNGQGKTRGTVAMLRIKATCNQSLVSIYPKDDSKLMPELIFANLAGRYNELRKLTGDTGNDRRGLNMSIIRNIKFSFPRSLVEQKSIVAKLNELSQDTKKLESIYKQKLVDLEELKKSILQKAFNGEL